MHNPTKKQTIGIIGTGVIGAGWATRFLANGHTVIAYSPAPNAEENLRKFVDRAITYSRKLTLFSGNDDNYDLRFVDSLAEMAAEADFIQESIPECEDLKRKVLAEISQHAKLDTIIASSSSGLLPTVIQQDCVNPGRILIGHPFNPVYLLPLVEVVGGEQTDDKTVTEAMAFYQSVGMHALKVRTEIEGYISDRLQEALWREILHMVSDGVATTQEIDEAIIYGPGLRWAMMGTCLTFHLAGGEQGMRHMLKQFSSTLELPWTHLKAPPLTNTLIDRMVEGTQAQAAGQSIDELANKRDECLIAIMRALRTNDYAAGNVLAKQEALAYGQREYQQYQCGVTIPAPLDVYHAHVSSEWIDYNQHMTDGAYMIAFGDAWDALARYIGCDEHYRESTQNSFFTAEAHINYYKEAKVGEPLAFTTQVIYADSKKIHLYHAMYHGQTKELLCTSEQMMLHVSLAESRVVPMQGEQYEALMALADAHKDLPCTGLLKIGKKFK